MEPSIGACRTTATIRFAAVKDLVSLALVALASGIAFFGTQPSPYFVISPGGTYDIASRIHVPDSYRQQTGRLAFTAVYEQEATWAAVLAAKLRRDSELVPARIARPHGESQEQINTLNQQLIDESKALATAVGLRAAGFDAPITGQGAEVLDVMAAGPSAGALVPNDVIVGVDGATIQTAAALIAAVRRRQVGEAVIIEVVRDGAQRSVAITTGPSPDDPRVPLIGVSIQTRGFDVQLPFPAEIDTGTVGGPSAGFMLALGVLDAVTTGDVARGYFVAGTGTISPDGTVGPIGGAAEKIVAAERDGAEVFLVPRQNLPDVLPRVKGIRVQPVDSLADAVGFLCRLEPRASESIVPGPCQA